ncbi:MAG TPA: SIMPL domain-containing protein [Candidatus Limnocylindrales bacterium]|nr:SIMPL domain-containing protein [Candidatus Limnocylindrales bacterium]
MQSARVCISFLMLAAALSAQAAGTIQATGTGTVNVNPDQVQLNVTISTDGATAAAATQQNATQSAAVTKALQQVLGNSGSLQTVGYSVYPRYSNSPGQASTIVGYTASNTLQITSSDLTLAGPLIDAANQAGATSTAGLNFGLKDSDPARLQALALASKQALAHASAIASGLGAHAGAVLSAQERAAVSTPIYTSLQGVASSTQITSGTIAVNATVTVTVQLTQ